MKSKFLLLIIFSTFGCNNLKQANYSDKIIENKYVANDKYFSKFNSISERKYKTEHNFIDYGILCACDTCDVCSIEFQIKNMDWYIWNGKKWKMLYDSKSRRLKSIKLKTINRTIKPLETYSGKDTIYSFSCQLNNVDFQSNYVEYLFSPKKGIIIIKNEQTFYTRSDYDSSWIEDQLINKH